MGEKYWEIYLAVTVQSPSSSTAAVLNTWARFRRYKMKAMQICCAQHRACKGQQQVESKADKGLFMLCVCVSVRHNRCIQQAALLCLFPFQVLVIHGNIQVSFPSITLGSCSVDVLDIHVCMCASTCHECPWLHTPGGSVIVFSFWDRNC